MFDLSAQEMFVKGGAYYGLPETTFQSSDFTFTSTLELDDGRFLSENIRAQSSSRTRITTRSAADLSFGFNKDILRSFILDMLMVFFTDRYCLSFQYPSLEIEQ